MSDMHRTITDIRGKVLKAQGKSIRAPWNHGEHLSSMTSDLLLKQMKVCCYNGHLKFLETLSKTEYWGKDQESDGESPPKPFTLAQIKQATQLFSPTSS